MKRARVLSPILLVAACLTLCAPVVRADSSSGWLSGAEGIAEARHLHGGRNKPMLVYFYTTWCPSCRNLEQKLLSSELVRGYLGDIAAVRVNAEGTQEERALAVQFGVSGYPSLYVVPDGTDQHKSLSPYRRQDDGLVLMTPEEFVQAARAAGERPRKKAAPAPRAARKKAAPSAVPEHQATLFLSDGRVVVGELVHENPEQVTLRLESGPIVFPRAEIERVITKDEAL